MSGCDQGWQSGRNRDSGGGPNTQYLVSPVQEGGHSNIPVPVRGRAQHHADQTQAIAHGALVNQIVAAGHRVAGLEAVGSGIGFQFGIVIEDGPTPEIEIGGAEIVILIGEVGNQSAGEDGAISLAVVHCSGAGRPEAFAKMVWSIPRARARTVII